MQSLKSTVSSLMAYDLTLLIELRIQIINAYAHSHTHAHAQIDSQKYT